MYDTYKTIINTSLVSDLFVLFGKMFYDETAGYYEENNDNYNDDVDEQDNVVSVHSDTISVASNVYKQRKILNSYKQSDANYCKIRRMMKVRVKDNIVSKKVDIEFYSTTNVPGFTIRDAITGARNENNLIGSIYEDLFFKVRLSTGEIKHDTPTLFFDSPEQYERKFGCTLDEPVKKSWRVKNAEARTYIERLSSN